MHGQAGPHRPQQTRPNTVDVTGASGLTFRAVLGLAAAGLLIGHLRAVPAWASPLPEDEESTGISAVMNLKLNGLSQLEFGARAQLREDASRYARFRKNKESSVEKAQWAARCQGGGPASIFCRPRDFEPSRGAVEAGRKGRGRTLAEELRQVQAAIARGELGVVAEASDRALSRALQQASKPADLKGLEQAVLGAKACQVERIAALMASRLEEHLPEPEALESSIRLYEKAAECRQSSEWSERGLYRASLLLLSRQEWSRAIPLLERLAQNKSSDFYSRAIYWRARAEKARGNALGFRQLAARLTKEFPIHYHSLLLAPRVLFNAAQNLHLPEPTVSFACEQIGAQWNDRARAIEALQELGAFEIAREFLAEMEDLMEPADAEARLYLAVLQHRNASTIGTFRVLSSLFREHPGMLSRQTLAIFFPLNKTLESFLQVAQGGGLDPYLIAALIRQESGFISTARSRAGALGLMQLMPATARTLEPVSRRELLDGRTNVRLGVKFFRRLLSRFDGKVDLALAAYNAGPNRVAEWQRRYRVSDPVLFVDLIPIKETREYVSLISRNYYWYLQIYARHIFDERTRVLASADPESTAISSKIPLEFSLFHSN